MTSDSPTLIRGPSPVPPLHHPDPLGGGGMKPRRTHIRDRNRARLRALGVPCHICGHPIDYTLRWPDPQSFVADHIKPRKHGGGDNMGNQGAAHKVCNERKAAREYAPDIIRRSGALN